MKILIATDAWTPQVNGVVTTLTSLVSELSKNHEVKVIEPSLFACLLYTSPSPRDRIASRMPSSA